MDNELIRSKAEEINSLHKDVFEAIKLGLDGAIRIGKLLTECKKEVGHGGWMRWMKDNLTFSQQTANNYMRLYAEGIADNPKLLSLSNLWEAEQALIQHKVKVKEPELPKEPDLLPEEEPEPLPVRLQPYVEEPEEETDAEPEIEEPEPDEQEDRARVRALRENSQYRLVEDIKALYGKLDWQHKHEIIDWIFEQGQLQKKEAA
jgi:hypothetical protein